MKPCPFCGDRPDDEDPDSYVYTKRDVLHVVCVGCEVVGPGATVTFQNKDDARRYARELWNTRITNTEKA